MLVPLDALALPKLDQAEVEALDRLRPGERGYWSDEELLADARLSSLPLLKKLQSVGLAVPGYLPVAGGGRRRAWLFRDVLKVAVAAELASRAKLAVLAVGAVLARAPSGWVEGAVEGRRALPRAEHEVTLNIAQSGGSRVCILDMTEVWMERAADDFELLSEDAVLAGADLVVSIIGQRQRTRKRSADLIRGRPVVLLLDLGELNLPFIDLVREARMTAGWRS